jgi:hypothetical protein
MATQLKAFNIQQVARMGFANKNFKVAYPAMMLWHMTDALSKLVSLIKDLLAPVLITRPLTDGIHDLNVPEEITGHR